MNSNLIQNIFWSVAGLLWLTIVAFLLWPDSEPGSSYEDWMSITQPGVPEQEDIFFSMVGFVSEKRDIHRAGIESVR